MGTRPPGPRATATAVHPLNGNRHGAASAAASLHRGRRRQSDALVIPGKDMVFALRSDQPARAPGKRQPHMKNEREPWGFSDPRSGQGYTGAHQDRNCSSCSAESAPLSSRSATVALPGPLVQCASSWVMRAWSPAACSCRSVTNCLCRRRACRADSAFLASLPQT